MSIIQPSGPPVITGPYLNSVLRSDWRSNRPPLGGGSLEDDVKQGDAWERQQALAKNVPFDVVSKVGRCPLFLSWDLDMLRNKDTGLSSLSDVGRHATRTGVLAMARVDALGKLRQARKTAYALRRESVLEMFTSPEFVLGGHMDPKPFYSRVYLWVAGDMADIARDLNTTLSDVTLVAMTFGVAQSATWTPDEAVEMCLIGLSKWVADIEERVALLNRMLS